MGFGLSGAVRYVSRGTTARATAKEYAKILYWLHDTARLSSWRTPARTDGFNPRSRAVGFGLSGAVRHASRGTTARATAKELEVASFAPGADRSFEAPRVSAPPGRSSVRSRPGPPKFSPG